MMVPPRPSRRRPCHHPCRRRRRCSTRRCPGCSSGSSCTRSTAYPDATALLRREEADALAGHRRAAARAGAGPALLRRGAAGDERRGHQPTPRPRPSARRLFMGAPTRTASAKEMTLAVTMRLRARYCVPNDVRSDVAGAGEEVFRRVRRPAPPALAAGPQARAWVRTDGGRPLEVFYEFGEQLAYALVYAYDDTAKKVRCAEQRRATASRAARRSKVPAGPPLHVHRSTACAGARPTTRRRWRRPS